MRITHLPVATGLATVVVLASAASFALDPVRGFRDGAVERTVALADLCGPESCSIAYKTGDGAGPSVVVPAR